MSELERLQRSAHAVRAQLDQSVRAAAEVKRHGDAIGAQLAALGNSAGAQALHESGRRWVAECLEHLRLAQWILDEYAADCERAKGEGLASGGPGPAPNPGRSAPATHRESRSTTDDEAAYIERNVDSRPWLASCAGQPVEVRSVLVALDRGQGHALERHEGWATDERLQRRVRGLEDPAQTDPDKRAAGVDAYKAGDKPLSHVCSELATAIQDPAAFATAYARGIEHPDVRAALDSDPSGLRPSAVRVPITDLLGPSGAVSCVGYRLQPVAGSLKSARDRRDEWIEAVAVDQEATAPAPVVEPVRSFDGGRVTFVFGRENDGGWGVLTMYAEPADE